MPMIGIDRLRFDLTSMMPKAGRHWRRIARSIAEAHGISEACALPLIAVGRLGDGVRQIVVADEVGIEGPSLVRILDRLCANGLLDRRDDAVDRRAKTLWLTAEGRRVTMEAEQELVVLRARVLRDISEQDLEVTLRVLRAFGDPPGRAQGQPVISQPVISQPAISQPAIKKEDEVP
ncbi:MAG TPA: MarR family winged helix-turn-helix transcriptional regulator [Stellaceae bacterium]|nr:MarR family winged helix-turn-helix transcriptional regulator [Stellaceae bacterium]